MLKKFVPLTSNESPSKNPYEVRTFLGDNCQKRTEWKAEQCPTIVRNCPPNNTLTKIMTIEDEIRRIHEKAQRSRFNKGFKPFCAFDDEYLACIIPQRTPQELKTHALLRERYLLTKRDLDMRVHDAKRRNRDKEPIQLAEPVAIAEYDESEQIEDELGEEEATEKRPVKPQAASPTCSLDAIYFPPENVLQMTRPTSGWFTNETEMPQFDDDGINYSVYNPRDIQPQFDAQGLGAYDLIEGKTPLDLWTWNIGKQARKDELDQQNNEARVLKFDCGDMELKLFKIPNDLEKTFRVEIVFGTQAIRPPEKAQSSKRQYYNRPPEISAIYAAYVDSFRLNPDFWTAETMNAILGIGNKLLKKSTDLNFKSPENDFDIITEVKDRSAVIGLKIHFTGPIQSEPNIFKTLYLYFSRYNAAVLTTENLYLLIWKRCSKSFYVFDPNGRNENCKRDWEGGNCSLISIQYVEHLVHLVMHYSATSPKANYNLYEIFLINFGKIENPVPTKPFMKMVRRNWAVVNKYYAIIPAANLGLSQPITGKEQNASMIISLVALLYSNIEMAREWRPETLDDLNKYGTNYFKNLLKRLRVKSTKYQLNILDLPEKMMLGVYKATFAKRSFLYTGHVAECKDFRESQLTMALRDLYSSSWELGLLQIDNSVLGVFRDLEFFYVFDPFRRGRVGQVLDPDDYRSRGVACLQLHTTFDSFCRVIYDKALQMRRGGKFFLHGIKVGCIKPLLAAASAYKNTYPKLKLEYPKFEEVEAKPDEDMPPAEGVGVGAGDGEEAAPPPKPKPTKQPKLEKTMSIKSLPEEEQLPEFTSADIVNTLLEEILCELISELPEPQPKRAKLYKQAEQVLLRTDKPYLQMLQYKLKHNLDDENLHTSRQAYPDAPQRATTLEEELKIPSNFELLPDGTWVIFGLTDLPILEEETTKLGGFLAGLVTLALTAKYRISTWNSELIEYALEAVNSFGSDFDNYEPTLAIFLNQKMPRITIGESTYELELSKILHASQTASLRQLLLQSLICYNRLMVICQRFSCVIIKRLNFLYMFIGFACNPVGYRKFGTGPACMLRFIELDALIRRIEFGCDPQGCEITNYVVVAIKVNDVTQEPPLRYRTMPSKDAKQLHGAERERLEYIRSRIGEKERFLDEELRRENERIEKFLAQKKKRAEERRKAREAKRKRRHGDMSGEIEGETEEGDETEIPAEEDEEEESEGVELKHMRGKQMHEAVVDEFLPRPVLYGYHMRNVDHLYKIQGSVALQDRETASPEVIKPCFFASAVAVIYAVLRPLNQWPATRVDRVVNTGVTIASRVTNMTTAYERIIKNITADEYTFDIWVKTYEPLGAEKLSLQRKLEHSFMARRYLLLQTSNATYALYADEFYHLFDPYNTMEKLSDAAEEEDPEEQELMRKRRHGVKKYCERKTASWVLFPDVKSMLKYIDQRAANPNWSDGGEYKLHIVDIIRFKKAKAKERILQLLTDMEVAPPCKCPDEQHICSRAESLAWLDMDSCLPVWSRLNRHNTAGRPRGIALTKVKKYDIEIDKRLWSLWGCLSPYAPCFSKESRGKQFLACNVIACTATQVFKLANWSPQLMDNIIISGDRYHRESMETIKKKDYEFSLEDLDTQCSLGDINFAVHLEYVAFGKLYARSTRQRMNLADALMYFFEFFDCGILQCQKRSLAIGRVLGHGGGYFMFDCQSQDHPLFPKGQGAAYLLRTTHLQVLLYCIIVTLNVPYYNVPFTIHKVEMLREGALVEETGNDDEEA